MKEHRPRPCFFTLHVHVVIILTLFLKRPRRSNKIYEELLSQTFLLADRYFSKCRCFWELELPPNIFGEQMHEVAHREAGNVWLS